MGQKNRQFVLLDSGKTNREVRGTGKNISDEAYSSDDSTSSTSSTSSIQTTNSSDPRAGNPFDARAEGLAILAETYLSKKHSARLHKLQRFFGRGRRGVSKRLLTRIRSADRALKEEAQGKFLVPWEDVEDVRLGKENSDGSHNDASSIEDEEHSDRSELKEDSEDLQDGLTPALQRFEHDVDEVLDAAVQVEGDVEEMIAFIEDGVISAFGRFQRELERVDG